MAPDRPLRRALLAVVLTLPAAAGCALIAGLSDHQPYPIAQVTAGADHACALTSAGKVWCWGANESGQLGRRTIDGGSCTLACPPGEVDGIDGATQISAGVGFTCAVQAGGKVQCWGRDDAKQLGRPTTETCQGNVACDPVPDAVAGITGAVQVAASDGYACARTSGAVTCWGSNQYGQLGTGNFLEPATLAPVKGLGVAIDLSTGLTGFNTCAAVSDGSVWCWGLDDQGGVGHKPGTGDTMSTDGKPCSPKPTKVPGIQGATAVRAGVNAGCALRAAGQPSCWGYDGLGGLGTGTTMPTSEVPPKAVSVVKGITAIDLRFDTTCAIDASGEVWCWGRSGVGAIGPEAMPGQPCDQGTPCRPLARKVGLGGAMQVATGASMALAITTDGKVWAWGLNVDGRLGHAPGMGGDAQCPKTGGPLCDGKPSVVGGLPH